MRPVHLTTKLTCTFVHADCDSLPSRFLPALGGSRRINPRNTHQTPVVAVLVGVGFKAAAAMAVARHLASHNVSVILCASHPQTEWIAVSN